MKTTLALVSAKNIPAGGANAAASAIVASRVISCSPQNQQCRGSGAFGSRPGLYPRPTKPYMFTQD